MPRLRRPVNLTEGTIWKQILLFALPVLVTNIMQQLYAIFDLMIIGRYAGLDAMAGVGATASVISMIINLSVGLATGVSVITAQVNGSGNYDGLYKVVHTGYAVAVVAGLVITGIGVGLAPIMLGWMQTPADIMPYAVRYLRIYLAGGLPVIIYNMGAGILRGVGDTRHPMIFLSIGVILNIGLDLLFVRVFDWGVTGAACAYVAAQIVTAILVTASLMLSHEPFRLFLRDISFHRDILPDTMKVGIPAGLQAFVIALSNVFLQAVINGFGKHAVAGFSVATRVDGFVFMIISAIALAVMTFTGANVGARRYKRARKGTYQGIALMVGIVIVVSGILLLLRYPIARAFNPDPNVVAYSTHIMIYILSLYWIFGITEVLAGSIRGLGQSVFPLGVTLVFMAGFRLLWIFSVVPVVQTFRVVVLAYPLSWTAALLAYLVYIWIKGGVVPKARIREEEAADAEAARRAASDDAPTSSSELSLEEMAALIQASEASKASKEENSSWR
ncbi:MAG: MATE family efflux transporter [Saccharofermentanales bacterium]|jgi:putative MATE family efflux protein